MLMKHNQHGLHHASGLEVEAMKKNGWTEIVVKSEPSKKETVIMTPQDTPSAKGKPGRKPKSYLGGIYGNNSEQD